MDRSKDYGSIDLYMVLTITAAIYCSVKNRSDAIFRYDELIIRMRI